MQEIKCPKLGKYACAKLTERKRIGIITSSQR